MLVQAAIELKNVVESHLKTATPDNVDSLSFVLAHLVTAIKELEIIEDRYADEAASQHDAMIAQAEEDAAANAWNDIDFDSEF